MATAALSLQVVEAADERFATVERNDLQRYPWTLRCYGQGVCTIGRGVPGHYANELVARRKAAVWIKTGVSPADQRDAL
jgi:hypothetical protein